MRYILILSLLLISTNTLGRNIRVILNHSNFYSPKGGHYVEVALQFLASSIHYVEVEGKMQGEVEVQFILSQQKKIIDFDKYRLKTTPIGDTLFEDFYSIRRFSVQPGDYALEFSVIDLNKPEDTISFIQDISVEDWSENLAFSDITLIESLRKSTEPTEFTKNGFEIIPRLSTYFPVESEKLIFYGEIYNTKLLGDSARFALRYFIADQQTGKVVGEYMGIKRLKANDVIPMLYSFNIDQLKSGEYILCFELLDDEGIVVRQKKLFFDRFNPIIENVYADVNETILDPRFMSEVPTDSLFFYLESLIPISSRAEEENIMKVLKKQDTLVAQKYFQSYWKKTAQLNPTEEWLKYKKLIGVVQQDYGTPLFPGFRTDRGRILLKYGPPNAIVSRPNEPNQYPYEIWQYYKIEQFSNKRFVFYNPTRVGNEYVLLHSDMPGELFNNRWEFELRTRGTTVDGRTRTNDEGIMEGGRRW